MIMIAPLEWRAPAQDAAGVGSPNDSIEAVGPVEERGGADQVGDGCVSRPTTRSASTCWFPKVIGVAVSATEAATMAFQRASSLASTPSSRRCHVVDPLGVGRGEAGMHRGAVDAAVQARRGRRRQLALGARQAGLGIVEDVLVGPRARFSTSGSRASSRK